MKANGLFWGKPEQPLEEDKGAQKTHKRELVTAWHAAQKPTCFGSLLFFAVAKQ